MSNLFKKVTSSVALLAVIFSIVSPIAGVNAMYTSSIDAANKLAQSGVITDKSANPADYRLGDNITRREMVKVAMQLAACQDVTLNTEYKGTFSDVASSDWAWKYAETAVDNAFIAANSTFSPARNVSKGEALKMVMNATQIAKSEAGISFWADYVAGGVAAGIVEDFTDYDTQAQRGWIFKAAASALDAGTCGAEDDTTLDDLLDGLDDTDGTDTGSTDTTDDTTTTGGTFTVALSPDTAASASIPGGVSGLPVASYDLTAGDSDVTVTSITVKRRGLSDKDTITSLAAFSSDGRASKGKDDSQNDNTEALLTLTNGFVVKAGETRTLTIVADTAVASIAANDEFAIELVEVVASATAQSEGTLVGNTLKIGSVDAPKILVQGNGSVSNPKLGDEGVDIFKFQVKGASDEDVVLKSITFRADNSNAADNLENFKVYLGSTEVASTAMMNDKYVTFTFGNGYTIAKNKVEKFTVKGDVVAGAGDIVKFYVDKALDVTANGTKFGYGASVDIGSLTVNNPGADAAGELGSITIQAGELTLVDIDAPSDKIREDKDDVVLGTIKVTNVAGKSLELQDFGIKAVISGTAFSNDVNDDNVANDTTNPTTNPPLTLATMLENVELYNVDSGASYELDLNTTYGNVYSDTDMGIALAQGTTTFQLRADTKDLIGKFNLAKLDLSLATGTLGANGAFKVVETEDDTVVSDITPSSLSWKTVSGLESGATVALTPLSSITKVRGANDVVALQFEVEAGESSAVNVDEIKAKIYSSSGTTVAATNQQVSQVALYKGSVSDANLLDRVSGSNLAAGVATFDGFDVAVAAKAKQTFVVTVSFVDGIDTVNVSDYKAQLTGVSAEDDDNDTVTITGLPLASARNIAVKNFGTLTITADSNNTDNKDDKTVLAGTSKVIYSADVQATNESVDVEKVVFTLSGSYDNSKTLKDVVTSASLYLGDTLVATNTNSDINAEGPNTIRFKDLTNLIIPQESKELRLALNTATIGFEKVGATTTALEVTNVAMPIAEGVDSGKVVTVTALASTSSKKTAIAPAVLTASVVKTLANGTAEVKFTLDSGSNSQSGSNNKPVVTLTDAVLTNLSGGTGFTVYNSDNAALTGATLGGINAYQRVVSDTETFVFVPQTTSQGTTYTTKIGKAAITYTVDGVATQINVNASADLDLGTKTY